MYNPQNFLAHLIPDPSFGYLLAHKLTIPALGVKSAYHLEKHRPKLREGQDWLKIAGSDRIERIFYTLNGLLLLSDYVGTQEGQSFKDALLSTMQPPPPQRPPAARYGAIVPASVTRLQRSPRIEDYLEDLEPAPIEVPVPPFTYRMPGGAMAQTTSDPLDLVAQRVAERLRPDLTGSMPAAPPPISAESAAELLFRQQEITSQQYREWSEQTQAAVKNAGHHTTTTIMSQTEAPRDRAETWLSNQEPWALALIVGSVIAMTGCGAFLLIGNAVSNQRRSVPPTYPQAVPQNYAPAPSYPYGW